MGKVGFIWGELDRGQPKDIDSSTQKALDESFESILDVVRSCARCLRDVPESGIGTMRIEVNLPDRTIDPEEHHRNLSKKAGLRGEPSWVPWVPWFAGDYRLLMWHLDAYGHEIEIELVRDDPHPEKHVAYPRRPLPPDLEQILGWDKSRRGGWLGSPV